MDINAAAKEYGNGIITSLKKNRRMLLMMLLFAAGMIFGAASVKKSDICLSGAFSDMFSVYISSKGTQSLGVNFINSLAVNAAFMLCICIRAVRGRTAAYMCSARNKRCGYRNAVGVFILEFRSARTRLLRFGDISGAYTGCFCAAARLQRRNKLVI